MDLDPILREFEDLDFRQEFVLHFLGDSVRLSLYFVRAFPVHITMKGSFLT